MFGLGKVELAAIIIIILVLFGPKYIPRLGSSIAGTISSIRNSLKK